MAHLLLKNFNFLFFYLHSRFYFPPVPPPDSSTYRTSSLPPSPQGNPHYPPPRPLTLWGLLSIEGWVHVFWMNPDPAVFCYICVGEFISAGVCWLVGIPVSERTRRFRLIETTGRPTMLLSSSSSSWFSIIETQCSAASVYWLGANICIWLSCLLDFSEGSHNMPLFCQALGPPLELDPTLGLWLDLILDRVLSISIAAVLSAGTIMGQSFECGMATSFLI